MSKFYVTITHVNAEMENKTHWVWFSSNWNVEDFTKGTHYVSDVLYATPLTQVEAEAFVEAYNEWAEAHWTGDYRCASIVTVPDLNLQATLGQVYA